MDLVEYGKNREKIAILAYYHFPCDHPVLENIFAKELARDQEVVFYIQGDTSKGSKQQWHNSQSLQIIFCYHLFKKLLKEHRMLLFAGMACVLLKSRSY